MLTRTSITLPPALEFRYSMADVILPHLRADLVVREQLFTSQVVNAADDFCIQVLLLTASEQLVIRMPWMPWKDLHHAIVSSADADHAQMQGTVHAGKLTGVLSQAQKFIARQGATKVK